MEAYTTILITRNHMNFLINHSYPGSTALYNYFKKNARTHHIGLYCKHPPSGAPAWKTYYTDTYGYTYWTNCAGDIIEEHLEGACAFLYDPRYTFEIYSTRPLPLKRLS